MLSIVRSELCVPILFAANSTNWANFRSGAGAPRRDAIQFTTKSTEITEKFIPVGAKQSWLCYLLCDPKTRLKPFCPRIPRIGRISVLVRALPRSGRPIHHKEHRDHGEVHSCRGEAVMIMLSIVRSEAWSQSFAANCAN